MVFRKCLTDNRFKIAVKCYFHQINNLHKHMKIIIATLFNPVQFKIFLDFFH